jgi:hypothetical protein
MSSLDFGSDEDENINSNRKKKRSISLRKSFKQGMTGSNHTPLPPLMSEASIDDDEGSVRSEGSAQVGRKKRGRKKTQQEHPELFAARETQQIWWLKGVTLVSFLIVTCMVSTVIFYSTKRFEKDQFEKTFQEQATTIGETFRSNLQRGVGALDSLAASITSTTASSSWPFVIVPDFAQRAAGTRELVKADLLSLVPLVPKAEREGADGWESFSVSVARNWIDDGLQLEASNVDYVDYHSRQRTERTRKLQTSTSTPVVYSTFGVATSIFRWEGQETVVDTENRFENYFPIWQNSPVQKDLVNFNLLSHDTFGTETQLALVESQIVLGSFVVSRESAEVPTNTATTEAFEAIRRHGEEPMSQIVFPVVESLAPGQVKPTIVAMLQAIVFWGDYLKGEVLPPSANGIICVINNGCGQTYAYQVVGDSANFTYLGEGAQSEKIFLQYEAVFEIGSVFDKGQVTYSGVTVNEDYCPYRLHVYPTETVQDSYFSRRPVVYTSLFGVVFIFTSAVFLCYDFLVERRQRRVMDTAVKSHEIVANLFPENIRGRLFGKEGKERGTDDGDVMGRQNTAAMMGDTRGSKARDGRPIADLFPATSVLFADIAGFTAWSSVRDPAQVSL